MSDFAVSAVIGATDRLTSVFTKAAGATEKFSNNTILGFKKSEESARKFKEVFLGVFAGISAQKLAERGIEMIKSIPEALDGLVSRGNEIAHTSQIIGTTAENYQKLIYAAHMQDIAQSDVVTSMQKLNNNMGQLKVNTGAMYTTLIRINPALANQLRHTTDTTQAMLELSDALKNTKNSQDRAAIAQAAFGRSGQVLLPLLLEGKNGIEKLMGEASKYGDVLSNSVIDQTLKADDTMKKIKGTMANLKDQVLGALLEKLTPLIDKVQEWVTANKDLIATKIKDFIQGAANVIDRVVELFKRWGPLIGTVVASIVVLKTAMIAAGVASTVFSVASGLIEAFSLVTGGAATVWEALNLVMSANPIGLIVIGIAALIAIVILAVKHWGEIKAWIDKAWESIKRFAVTVGTAVIGALKKAGEAVLSYFLAPLNLLIDAVRGALTLLSHIPGVGGALKSAADWLGSTQAKGNAFLGTTNPTDLLAPHKAGAVTVNNSVNVDNSMAQGVNSSVRTSQDISGAQGPAWHGGMQ